MTGKKICRVCGKEYEYCKTWRSTGVFRYQDVACSKECGSIYLAGILKSRGKLPEDNQDAWDKSKINLTVSDCDAEPTGIVDSIKEDTIEKDEPAQGEIGYWFDDDLDEDEDDDENADF